MALYEQLKIDIQNAIKENGNHEITGYILQKSLLDIVDVLGEDIYNALSFTNNGIAKNSELLEGHPASYFATVEYAGLINDRVTTLSSNLDTKVTELKSYTDTSVSGLRSYIDTMWIINSDGYLYTDKPVFINNLMVATKGTGAGSVGTPITGLLSGVKVGETIYTNIVDNLLDLTEAFSNVTVDLTGYATETWVTNKGYITANALTGYATETWVINKGYATEDWVTGKGYASATDLSALRKDFDALYKVLNDDTAGVINTWNEVVDFLKGYGESADLATLLSSMNSDIASRALATRKISGDGTTIVGGGDLTDDRTLGLKSGVVTTGTYTKVSVDTYGRVTAGALLVESDIPALSIAKIAGLQSTLDTFVTLAGTQTIIGSKTFTSPSYYKNSIFLGSGTANNICLSGDGIRLHDASNSFTSDVLIFDSNTIVSSKHINPSDTALCLGTSGLRWRYLYSQYGNFSEELQVKSLKIGGVTLTETSGVLTVNGLLLALNGLASATALSESSGTGSLIFTGPWSDYTSEKSDYALAASLGYDLYSRVTTLEGKATNVSFTQSIAAGKQIGTISIDGKATNLYAPSTYAWSEITSKPSFASVATSGSYNDLSNKPTIATLMGSNAIGSTTAYAYWNGTSWVSKTLGSNAFTSITKVSQLSNDSSFITGITKSMVEGVLTGDITSHTHTFASLTSKPTTISGYGITDAYTKTEVNNALSGYLPLSGGVISRTDRRQLLLNNPNANGESALWIGGEFERFKYGGILSYIKTDNTIVLGNFAAYNNNTTGLSSLRITANNKVQVGDANWTTGCIYDIIHSGNYNSYAPTLTGTGASGTWGINISGNAATSTRTKYVETLAIDGKSWYGDNYKIYAQWDSNGTTCDWRVDNYTVRVDKAKKLDKSVTIWGQSFNGTGNIGDAGKSQWLFLNSGGEGIYFSSAGMAWHNSSNSYVNGLMAFNSYGNVTIGSSDRASTSFKLFAEGKGAFEQADGTRILLEGSVDGNGGGGLAFFDASGFKRGTITANPLMLNATGGGNVLIGTTTDSGYKLYVNGTSYQTGRATIAGGITSKGDHDFLSHSDEFNFIPDSFSGAVCINWRTTSGTTNGAVSEYLFLRGAAKSYADIRCKNLYATGDTLTIGSATLTWNGSALVIDKPLVSTSFAAGATATASSGGGSYGPVRINVTALCVTARNVPQSTLDSYGLTATVIQNMADGLYTKVVDTQNRASWTYEAEIDDRWKSVWIRRGDTFGTNDGISMWSRADGSIWAIDYNEM